MSASPRATRSWLSWITSAPVIPSSRVRQSGTLPYSSTTGDPLPVLYTACPWLITCPADGSQVSVPPPRPVTGKDPAYPSVAFTGVVAVIFSRATAAVAGAGAPCCPAPGEAAGENTPACHPATAPATTTTTTPRPTQRPRLRGPPASADTRPSARCPAARPREIVLLITSPPDSPARTPAGQPRPPASSG